MGYFYVMRRKAAIGRREICKISHKLLMSSSEGNYLPLMINLMKVIVKFRGFAVSLLLREKLLLVLQAVTR
jgi:hypothetical protein